jgi:hypothetical protein
MMSPGPSSIITKAVIEVFAPRFLANPAVVWISESSRKVVDKDDALLRLLGIQISPEKLLPDVILADTAGPLIFVFVEVVATEGPVHEERRRNLLRARSLQVDSADPGDGVSPAGLAVRPGGKQ